MVLNRIFHFFLLDILSDREKPVSQDRYSLNLMHVLQNLLFLRAVVSSYQGKEAK